VVSSRHTEQPLASTRHIGLREFVIGLVALPLSLLPFLAYMTLTPEGRLVRDKIQATFFAPDLPTLAPTERWYLAAGAPNYGERVMALAYHGVGTTSDGDGGFVVSPKKFAEHLASLQAAGMTTVTAAEIADAFAGGKPLPPKAVMISFDDGRADAMLFADRLLEKAGMKATMFVITGAASNPGIYYASWGRLESAARSGRWDIQAHTDASHFEQPVADGSRLPALTSLAPHETLDQYRVRVREDLERSGAAIEEHIGRRPTAFAYPFGAYGAERTNDEAIRGILREEVARHYRVAFHQDGQDSVPLASPGHDLLGLRRLEVENWSGGELIGRIAEAARVEPAPPAPVAVPPVNAPTGQPPSTPAPAPTVHTPIPLPLNTPVAVPIAVPNLTTPSPGVLTTKPTLPAARPPSTTTSTTTPTSPTTTTTTTVVTTTTTAPPTTQPPCGGGAGKCRKQS